VFVKICGVRSAEAVEAAARAGANAVGLVFAPGFWRRLPLEEGRELAILAESLGLERVGVFVAQPAYEVEAVAEAVGLDTVQLHASTDDTARPLRRRWRVARAWQPDEPWPQEADRVLAESAGGKGSGRRWDWARVRDLPVVLGGGLTPENVLEALEAARPLGVDVSSGVEVGGRKDPERIRAFCEAVRSWEVGRREPA
jgi:phosphoribosylanthranilate isomerase